MDYTADIGGQQTLSLAETFSETIRHRWETSAGLGRVRTATGIVKLGCVTGSTPPARRVPAPEQEPPMNASLSRSLTDRSFRAVWISLLALLSLLAITLYPLGTAQAQPAGGPPGLVANENANPNAGPPAAAEESSRVPKVTVVATGGTIAGTARDGNPFGYQSYRAGQILMEQLVAESFALHEEWAESQGVPPVADVDVVQSGNSGSGGVTFDRLLTLSRQVDEALQTSDGVVVTSGTDTMEEIGRFLDLTVRSPKPVVITGAMRPWDVVGTDGPANLYNAIVTAASGKTAWFGTVLMLNDEIHAVSDVTKGNTLRMDTFDTPQLGMLGYVDRDRVRIYRATPRAMRVLDGMTGNAISMPAALDAWQTPFDLSEIDSADDLARVELLYSYHQGAEGLGDAVNAWVEAGVDGIVTAGTGAGGFPGSARNPAVEAGVVFVSSSRTGSGSVYSGSTSGDIPEGQGTVIPGDNMRPQAARILLMLALTYFDDVEDVRDAVIEWGHAEADVASRLPAIPAGVTP
jgi:L-asparaginase